MSAEIVNIPRTIQDPTYRYKMPKIQITVQGTGGGVKTRIDNIEDVAAALKLPKDYPLYFLKRELNTNADIKDNNYLLNGSHEAEKLQSLLDKYINLKF